MKLSILQQKIAEAKSRGSRNVVWKPDPGDYTIRIVPYKHNADWPFSDMYFYYRITTPPRTILSPITFKRPDPIKEFVETLYATGTEENKKLAQLLAPKRRIYVPIIVRDYESEGVKFWGMSPTVYDELLLLMEDPDFGDITHPTDGHDIKITIPKSKPGSFEGPKVRVRPKPSPMTDEQSVLKAIDSVPNIMEQWVEPSYDELYDILKQFASDNDSDDEQEAPAPKTVKPGSSVKSQQTDDDDDDAPKKPRKPAVAETEEDDDNDGDDDGNGGSQPNKPDMRASFQKYFKK